MTPEEVLESLETRHVGRATLLEAGDAFQNATLGDSLGDGWESGFWQR